MNFNRKTVVTVTLSALAGSLLGGTIMFFTVTYFLGLFFADAVATSSAVRLDTSVRALESLRKGDSEKAIETLNFEVYSNLITIGGMEEEAHSSTKQTIHKSISRAKKYLKQYPIKPTSEDGNILLNEALGKVE